MPTRSKQVNFRVTDKEYATLHKRSVTSGMTLGNFLIYSASPIYVNPIGERTDKANNQAHRVHKNHRK